MRNRAKCLKCLSVIESFHATDYVFCKCDEIALDGGEGMKCFAKDWVNFVRVDDNGNEIIPKIKNVIEAPKTPSHATLADDISNGNNIKNAIEFMIDSYEKLPREAMLAPATNADILSVLLLMKEINKLT